MIKHIVLFSLKDPANAPKVKALLDGCKDLVPGMREFEVGIKTEGLEATADVVLVSTFEDEAALAAYQPHPHHQAVVAQIREMASGRQVLDYRC